MQPLKNDAEGSQEFLNTLKHNPDESLTDLERTKFPEVEERLERLIDKVKSGELQLNDGKKSSILSKEDQEFVDTLSKPQFDSFKRAVQEQVNAKGQRFEEAKKTLESNMSKRKGWSDSFSSITGGAWKINSKIMQAQQEEQRANSTQYETAKKQLDSLQNETEKQSD